MKVLIRGKAPNGSSLMSMPKEEDLKDVTLVGDDFQVIKAHKNQLIKSSVVFEKIINLQGGKDSFIFIKGSSHEQLKAFLNFIYTGETLVYLEDLGTIQELALYFQIKGFFNTKSTTISENQDVRILEPKDQKKELKGMAQESSISPPDYDVVMTEQVSGPKEPKMLGRHMPTTPKAFPSV